MWKYTGRNRPPFAEKPRAGQESAWDYPRPPRLEHSRKNIVVRIGEATLAQSNNALRLLETASPPGYYLPVEDVDMQLLIPSGSVSYCEWKGGAVYWLLAGSGRTLPVGWSYPEPNRDYDRIRGHLSFYPGRVDCYLDGEKVLAQPGNFYGGWISSEVAGPFKGNPGTGNW